MLWLDRAWHYVHFFRSWRTNAAVIVVARKGKGKDKKPANFGDPNSREGACKTYRRTGECKWGAKCTWRHTREDDSDAEDDRGI